MRKWRKKETFEVECWRCFGVVEVPCNTVRNNIGLCPRCGSRLEIRWREVQS
jgi:rRNA maturation endonuclease Nob1